VTMYFCWVQARDFKLPGSSSVRAITFCLSVYLTWYKWRKESPKTF